VLFPAGDMPTRPCYRNRDQALLSLWPNTDDPAYSTSYNIDVLEQRAARMKSGDCVDDIGQNWCGLLVSQLQLTFRAGTFVRCINGQASPCSLFAYSQMVNNAIADEFHSWRFKDDLPTNIAMVDFYQVSRPSIPRNLIADNWRVVDG
jgi:hypothetical protein